MAASERRKKIFDALTPVYGNGMMVVELATHLDRNWDNWVQGEDLAQYGEGLKYAVHMTCWNWFAGGGTAEIAAEKVIAAVE